MTTPVLADPPIHVSDHFNGERFFNPHSAGRPSMRKAAWKFFLATRRPEYKTIDVAPSKPPASAPPGKMRVTWVGHATVLLQIDGINILTDPIWSQRASPVTWAGPKRWAAPGVAFDDLPPIHAVLLSHNHYDSMDKATLLRLYKTHHPDFFVPLGNAKILQGWGIEKVHELDWWDKETFMDAQIHCVPAQHFSTRYPWDSDKALWSGWAVIRGGQRFYFAGDSGYSPDFKEIGRRLGPFTLAAIPIGAYEPRDFMGPVHIDPEEAVKIHQDVRSQQSLAIHFNTFRLTWEPRQEPPERLRRALEKEDIPLERFWVLAHGESREKR